MASSVGVLAHEVVQAGEPVHVEALVLVQGHALDEGAQVLVDAKPFQVVRQRVLDALVEG